MVKKAEGQALNPEQVQAAYAKAFPQIKEAIEQLHETSGHPQVKAHMSRAGGEFARMASIDWQNLAGTLTGEFCKDWPVVKQALGFIETLKSIPLLSWVVPSIAAVLGIVAPVISMVDSFYPQVCGVAAGAGTGTTGGREPGQRNG